MKAAVSVPVKKTKEAITNRSADWDPTSAEVQRDQRTAYDVMRQRCPVAYSDLMGWSLFRHEDVMRVLLDHETFSSAVSRHLSVPSGMDPPQHTPFRQIIEPYFSEERMKDFEPSCRKIVANLIPGLAQQNEVEFMAEVALRFAVQAQCAFLGWPAAWHDTLTNWMRESQAATLAQDRAAMSRVAAEFDAIIGNLVETRQRLAPAPKDDVIRMGLGHWH